MVFFLVGSGYWRGETIKSVKNIYHLMGRVEMGLSKTSEGNKSHWIDFL